MRQKVFGLIFTLFIVSLLAACGDSDDSSASEETTEGSGDAEYVFRLPHIVQTDHPAHQAAEFFKEQVERESDGQIEIELFPNGELYGSDRELIEALQIGNVDISLVGTPSLGNFEESLYVLDLPFIFPNKEVPREALAGELGEELANKLEAINLKTLAWGYDGFRHLLNDKQPIESVEDLKGMKIRVQESELQQDIFVELGANASPLSFGELYQALQQKTFDGMEAPLSTIDSDKFYEVQSYMSLTGHQYSGLALLMSHQIFEELPSDLQDIIVQAGKATEDVYYELVDESEESLLQEYIENETFEITELTDEQLQGFIELSEPVYEKYADVIGQDIIDLARSYSQ